MSVNPASANPPASPTDITPAPPPLAAPDDALLGGQVEVSKNGDIMLDGKSYNILTILLKVQQESRARAKDRLSITMSELKEANKLAKAATEWLNVVRAVDYSHHHKVIASKLLPDHQKFVERYGMDPDHFLDGVYRLDTRHHRHHSHHFHQWKKKTIDYAVESIKAFISKNGSKQEALQLDVQRYTHALDETVRAMNSIEKSYHHTVQGME